VAPARREVVLSQRDREYCRKTCRYVGNDTPENRSAAFSQLVWKPSVRTAHAFAFWHSGALAGMNLSRVAIAVGADTFGGIGLDADPLLSSRGATYAAKAAALCHLAGARIYNVSASLPQAVSRRASAYPAAGDP
jgi:hypothetical protein